MLADKNETKLQEVGVTGLVNCLDTIMLEV